MSKWGKPLRMLILFVWGAFLVGLAVSSVNIQSVVAEQQKSPNPAHLFQSYQAAELNASDGAANDGFGWSVAVSDNIIVVGATSASKGAAYVFVKPNIGWHGVLTETAKLVASDGVASDGFGYAVAIENDTIVVSAWDHDGYKGAAYVFLKPSGGWRGTLTETAKLIASDGESNDQFGTSVDLNDDTIIVAADYDDVGVNDDQGSAYVFVKPSSGWSGSITETAKLIASDGAADDAFGTSTRISGDTVVVGARSDSSHQGSAYVFVEPGSGWGGTLTETAKLISSDGAAGDFFGVSVGISDDTIVSGAIFHDLSQGAAYVFVKPQSGWGGTLTETAKLIVSDGEGGDRLGVSVAISGDTVAAGADSDDNKGAAYVFTEPENSWSGALTESTKLTATNGKTGDLLGESIAIDGDTIVVGAVYGNDDKGSAYIFVSNVVYIPLILK